MIKPVSCIDPTGSEAGKRCFRHSSGSLEKSERFSESHRKQNPLPRQRATRLKR
jgi:hypothetical protein